MNHKHTFIIILLFCGLFSSVFHHVAHCQTDETVLSVSWQKTKPRLLDKKLCDSSKTIVLIYTELEDFFLEDGVDMAIPLSSELVVNEVRKHTFCFSHPRPDFIAKTSIANDSLVEAVAFIVGNKGRQNLYRIEKLIEEIERENQPFESESPNIQSIEVSNTFIKTATLQIETNENVMVTEFKNVLLPDTQSVNISDVAVDTSISQTEIERDTILAKKEYRIQIVATKKLTLDEIAIKKQYKLPYPVTLDFDGTWHRFTIGSFESLTDAKELLQIIRETYRLKDAFIVIYQNNKRISLL